MGTRSKERRVPVICMAGAVIAAAGVISTPRAALAQSLDAVLQRLEKLEKENAALRARVNHLESGKGYAAPVAVAAPAPAADGSFKGNPVLHGAVATSPAPAPAPAVGVAGMPVKTPFGPVIDNTTVTIYGHADLSFDTFNNSVYDQGTKSGIASNGSYFGIRARHNLAPYGYEGYSVVAQFESQVDVASSPTERAAFGTRDSFLGIEAPWGAIKLGKTDTPYKKSTAAFDPFANTIADYNSVFGNTGGDNRAEFDWRMNHAIWYESPIWNGFQFSALFSPGQNLAPDNSDFAYGDLGNCNGATPRGSGSNFPGTSGFTPGQIGGNGCTDGSYGNAFSAAATYRNGPFTAIAAYELHQNVNRHGDDGLENPALAVPVFLPDGSQVFTGVADEWAAKVGAGYRFDDPLGPLQLYAAYEWMRREVPAAFEPFNERSKDDAFVSVTQRVGEHWAFSGSFIWSGNTPGAPTCLSLNNPNAGVGCVVPGPIVQIGQYQQNAFDETTYQYNLGTRYYFNSWASWYLVGAWLENGPGAHFCLGASGHGYQICSRDQFNNTIGGTTIKSVSTGLTFDF